MLQKLRKNNIVVLLLVVVVSCLASCEPDVAYSHYDHTQIQGWERSDTLSFNVPPIVRPGNYTTTLGLRVDGSYPFSSLYLVVEQTIFPKHIVRRDTVKCVIADKNGNMLGHGANYYQYEFPTKLNAPLAPGDSIHYCVRQIMKRGILPGISDVGITLTRSKK